MAKSTSKYMFRTGRVLIIKNAAQADPEVIGESLEKISNDFDGKLTPQRVVATARDPNHALHKHFEWDDKIAAEQRRRDQARDLIQCIHVRSDDTDSGVAPYFLSVRDETGISYRTVKEVIKSVDLQRLVLDAALRELQSWQARYKQFEDICVLVRKAEEKLQKRRKTESEARASA